MSARPRRWLPWSVSLACLALACGSDDAASGPVQAGAGQAGAVSAGAGGGVAGGGGAGQGGAGGSGQGGAGGSGQSGAGGSGQGGDSGAGGAAGQGDPCALSAEPVGNELTYRMPDVPVYRPGEGGSEELTSLYALRAACEAPSLLVVRVEASWCAPCGLRADRTAEVLAPVLGPAVSVYTLLYAGPDNARPTAQDLAAWQKAHPGLPGGFLRAADGAGEALVRGHGTPPLVFLIDARTMEISNVLEAPGERFLLEMVASSLEEVGGPKIKLPPEEAVTYVDDRFDPFDWALIQQMAAPFVPPPDPSNAHADDPAAAVLGEALFNDGALAGDEAISCATCHKKEQGFADGLPTAKGVAVGSINTPTALASLNRWFFWDGRADSLWSQALGPLENPSETNGSRLHVAHRVSGQHAAAYEAIFGPLPPLEDAQRFPPAGKPGDAAYDAMAPDDQAAVTRVFVNVGKAIEAFERTLTPPPGRLELYAQGDVDTLTPLERNGLLAFIHSGCVTCHSGPALSDGAFHNILMPSSALDGPGDRGRIDGLPRLLASPFRQDGVHSDDPSAGAALASLVVGDEMLGQMKTPPLRNVTLTGPWGHGGVFPKLEDVIKHYGQVVLTSEAGPRAVGTRDPSLAGFLPGHNAELLAFLGVLGAL